ncbi:MAG: hypothetical protein ACK56I_34135, partial [bacterium]
MQTRKRPSNQPGKSSPELRCLSHSALIVHALLPLLLFPAREHDEDIWQQPARAPVAAPAPSVSYNRAVANPHYYNNAPVTVNTPVTVNLPSNCPACTVHPHPCPAVCPSDSDPPAQNAPGVGAEAAERAAAEALVVAAQKHAEETAAEAAAAAEKAAAEAAVLE